MNRRRSIIFLICTFVLFVMLSIHAENPQEIILVTNPSSPHNQAVPAANTEDFVDLLSDLHAPADLGTHDVFADLQDHGSNNDAMTEEDIGGSGINEYRYVDTAPGTPAWSTNGSAPYLDAQDQPTNYIYTITNSLVSGWFEFAETSGTGTGFAANCSVYWVAVTDSSFSWEIDWTGDDTADASGGVITTQTTWGWSDLGTISGLDTQTEIDAARIRFTYDKGGAQPDQCSIDAARIGINRTAASNHQLDLEVAWTAVGYDETNEELCIYPVTGGGWPTEDIIVDVWNGAWVAVFSDLTPDAWNNMSISSYLTGSAFEIRFLGGTETGDTAQSTWEIDAVLIHTWTPIYTPAIDQAPTLDNPSDTDNLYAQYLEYQVTVYVSDQNGFGDIDYLEIGLWDDTSTTEYCRFRYDEDTNTFTEEYDAGTYVTLNTGSSTATESGNDIDATFYLTVDWDFPDSTDLDANCSAIDTQGESATTWYEVDWDVETRLGYSVTPSIDDGSGTADRGNLDGSFSLTGTVIYYDSVDDYPSSSAVDVWVSASEYGTGVGPWSALTLDSGAFDVTCYADDQVGLTPDTYTVKIVEEGAGSDGSDLYFSSSFTDTYIADQLIISITDPVDQRINVGENATGILVSAIYDYDDSPFDGTLTLNDTTYNYGTAGLRGYSVSSASGDTHGVSFIGIDDATYCIWDSLTVTITDPADQRTNINTNATGIIVTAIYDYDGSTFDGTLTLNNTQFQYSTAQIQYYTVQSVSGGIYGVTIISSNDVTWCIWDSLTVTITDPADQRQNVNVNATGIRASATYDYDGSPFDGTLTLNNTQFQYSTAQIQYYTVQSVTGGIYGITIISSNDVTWFIWDSLTITIAGPSDQRIDINANATGIVVTAIYDYDGTSFEGTLTLNNTQYDYPSAQIQWYTVGSVNGGIHGITAISSNDITWCIWDSLTITITDPADQRQNVNVNATGIFVTAIYDYDGSVFDGTLSLNNTQYIYSTAQRQDYTVNLVSGGTHGITAISANDVTWFIWDSLTITITDPPDQRINIGAAATGIVATAIYDYDGTAFDGTLTLNSTEFQYGTAQIQYYTVQSVTGGIHGITAVSSNDVTWCIWDSLTITITDPVDQRQNVNVNATGIFVSAVYDYDGSSFDGTLTLNNTQFSYPTAQRQGYTVQSVSGGAHGITAISTNDATYFIWDSLTILITDPADQRINVNTAASGVTATAVYDYDGTAFDGTLTLNNTQFTYSTAQIQWYTVGSASGGIHGVSAINTNDVTWCIWDSLTIMISNPADQRININMAATGIVATAVYDYDGAAFDGTLTLNNTQFTYSVAQIQWYTVDTVNGGTHGITAISSNDMTWCIWDSLTITMTDPVDQRININVNATGIVVSATYDYDLTPYGGTLVLNDTIYSDSSVGHRGYTVISATGDDAYGITAISVNDETWCIWDQVIVLSYSSDDSRIDINTASTCHAELRYAYDYSYVIDGIVTVNGLSATYSGASGIWNFGETRVSVQMLTYDNVVTSGNQHGISVVNQNGQTQSQIWDRVQVQSYTVTDSRVNVGDSVNVDVTLYYDYDNSQMTDGIVTIDSIVATNRGSGIWRISVSELSVVGNTYDTVAVSGNSYGIAAVDQNSQTQLVIWDQVVVQGYVVADTRVNIGTSVNVDVTLVYAYDSAPIIDGTVLINTLLATHQGAGVWRLVQSRSVAQGVTYSSIACSGNTNGISLVNQNGQSQQVVWDSLTITISGPPDQRININENATGIIVTAVYDYDSTPFDGTLTLNNTVFNYAIAQKQGYRVLSASGGTYGISAIRLNDETYCIWDSLTIAISDPLDQRVNINTNASGIVVIAMYDYDFTPYDGTLNLNDTIFQYSTVGRRGYTVASAVGDDPYGIAAIRQNDLTWCIWDQVVVVSYSTDDSRINVGTPSTLHVTLEYEYDGSFVVDGAVTVNGISATYSGSNGVWNFGEVRLAVQLLTYNSVVASGNIHGITSVNQNGMTLDQIWDRVQVQSYVVDDAHANINDDVNIDVTLVYDYDNSPVTDGAVTINDISAGHLGSGVWTIVENRLTAQSVTYDTVACSANLYGISQVDQNGLSQSVIWDEIVVRGYSVIDDRVDINTDVYIYVTLEFEYDDSDVTTGTVAINGFIASHQGAGVWRITQSRSPAQGVAYGSVVCSGNVHGITSVNQNSQTQLVIWDSLSISITDPSDQRINVNSNASGIVIVITYDYDSAIYEGSFNLNNTVFQYATAQKQAYYVTSVNGDDAYAITAISSFDVTWCIWDSLTVTITNPTDQRINIGENASGIVVTALYDYDSTPYDGILTLNNTVFTYAVVGRQGYAAASAAGNDAYGITVIRVNDQTWCIWDQVVVVSYSSDDSRINVGASSSCHVILHYDYDEAIVVDGTVTVNGVGATYSGSSGVWDFSEIKVAVQLFTYDSVLVSGNTYGIDTADQNGRSLGQIWDRVQVQSYTVTDSRVNVGNNVNIDVILRYDYDDSFVTDGSVAINGLAATYQGLGVWRAVDSESSVVSNTYNLVMVSGNSNGISVVDQNSQSQQVVWDRIIVRGFTVVDARVNLNDIVNIDVELEYEYDSTDLMDGSVSVNGVSATYQGLGIWRITVAEASVTGSTYNSVSCAGNGQGITAVYQNGQTQLVVWDQVAVRGYSVADSRVNLGTGVNVDVALEYEYDDSPVTDGAVAINGLSASHIGSGVWRVTDTEIIVISNVYNAVVCSGNSYGITNVNQNGQMQEVIWDQVTVRSYSASDTRDNVGDSIIVYVVLEYEYDDSDVINGIVVVDGVTFTYTGSSGQWSATRIQAAVTWETYDSVTVSGNTHGITSVNQNAQAIIIIWDRVQVQSYLVSDSRVNVGDSVTVDVTLYYDFDNSPLIDGTVTINGILAANQGSGIWRITDSEVSVGDNTYNNVAVSGNTLGITVVDQSSKSTTIIWDRIIVIALYSDDTRINVGTACSGHVALQYTYDSTYVADGAITVNGVVATYSGSNGIWDFAEARGAVQLFTYNSVVAFGNTHGITSVNQNGQSASQIWDQLRVIGYSVTDSRCDVGSIQNVTAIVVYEYDSTLFSGARGTVYLNGSAMVWDGVAYRWSQERTSSVVGRLVFGVSAITDTYHGISVFQTTARPAIIWDALTISIAIVDNRININQVASVQASATYAYDGTSYEGSLTLNNTQFSYPTAQIQWYTVSSAAGDFIYDITVIGTNDIESCIWDSLTILIAGPTDQRININTNASGIVVSAIYDYDGSSYDGTLTLNNTMFMYPTAQKQGYRVATAIGDDSYGITVISTNDATYCIWDSLTITITDPVDQRININQNASGIIVTAIYDYDSTQYTGTLNLNDTIFQYSTAGRRGYRVANAAGNDLYGISAISLNDETYCIWDRLHIIISADSSSPYNDIQVNFTLTITFESDGIACTSYEVRVARNATHWHTFTYSNRSLFVDRNSEVIYEYIVSGVNLETLYGITAFTTSAQWVSWSAEPNKAPTNDSAPELLNADDTDNMYARYKFYTIISNVSDGDGGWDIDYIELTLYNDARTEVVWVVRYTVSGDTFTVEFGSDYVELATWSSVSVFGSSISVSWQIKIDWDHADLVDVDVLQYVNDGTNFDQDFYEENWDVETRVVTTGLTLDDDSGTNDRGSLDGSFTISGVISYFGSLLNPLSNETDIWVSSSEYGTNIGPWSDQELESGAFSVTCYADDGVGIDTYTVTVVKEGGSSGDTNLLQNVVQDTYVADRVQVQSYTITDTRVNINIVVIIDVTLYYDYDNTLVTSGLVTVNGFAATHQGSGVWRFSDSETVVTAVVYNTVTHIGGLHGVDVVDQNGKSLTVIWDKITVRSYSAVDARVNINDNALVDVTIEYEYDDSPVVDGSVTVNGISATHQGSGVWRITDTESIVTANAYNSVACTGNVLGITVVDQNSQSLQVIWDQIAVRGYAASDARANVNENVNVDVTIEYEYDDSPVTDGTVTINGVSAVHQVSGVWRIVDSEPSVVQNIYNLVTCSGNLYGITNVNQNAKTQSIIWDRVIVVSYSTDDNRININTAASDHVTLRYEYDSSPVTDGSTTINGVIAAYSGANGIWNFGATRATAQLVVYDTVSVSGNLYGISITNQNAQTLQQIWDSLTISITDPVDQRINLNENASGIVVTAVYDFDGSAYDGSLILNDTVFQRSTFGRRGYEVQSAGGGTHGITAIAANDETYAIWDSLTITITVSDSRINIGQNASIYVSAVYNYDQLTYDGTLVLNDTTYLFSSVGRHSYTVISASGDSHDITVIGTNDVESIIWDRLRVTSYSVSDARCNVGSIQTIAAVVIYEYDDVVFTGTRGTVYLNGTSMTWDPVDYRWEQQRSSPIMSRVMFVVTSITDTFHGLNMVAPGLGTSIIWDSLAISLSIADNRINVGASATIQVSAVYDYDGATYDGTLSLNNTQYMYATAQKQGYTVSAAAGNDAFGITAIGTNDEVYCIWDSLTILITGPSDQRINIYTNASGITVSATYDYDGTLYTGTLVLNNNVFQYSVAQRKDYTVSAALGNDAYGITVISSNDVTFCIWDSLTIYISNPVDQRININTSASGIVVSAMYDYDSSTFDGVLLLNDTTFNHVIVGRYGYSVASASGGIYGISAISTNAETYCVFDRLMVTIGVDDGTPYNDHQANFTLTVVFAYDSTQCSTYQVMISRNGTHWRSFINANTSLFVDTHADTSYQYTSTAITAESLYGITAFTTNTLQVTWSIAPNEIPTNDVAPQITNADDTDNLYARYRFYTVTSSVTDLDGSADIDFVELSLYDDTRSLLVWTIRYAVLTGSFSIAQGSEYVALGSWASASSRSTGFDITWVIKVDWDHPDLVNIDMRQYVTDGSDSDEDFYEVDWDTETRLNYATAPSLSDDRGDISTSNLWASSTLIYYGSSNLHPLANETDVWVIHDVSGTWSTDVDGSGQFTVTNIGSSSLVRLNLYTFKVVSEGAGAGGMDLYYASSRTDTFVTDRIEFYISGVDDSRINVNTQGRVYWSARYDYGDVAISSGLVVSLNGSKALSWNGSHWIYTEVQSSVKSVGYAIALAVDSTYGLNSWIQTAPDAFIVWDRIVVRSTVVDDSRVSVTQAVEVRVTLWLEYDHTFLGLGDSVTLDGQAMTWDTADSRFELSRSQSAVGRWRYYVNASAESVYGITALSLDGRSVDIIWDRVAVSAISVSDGRVGVGSSVEIRVRLWLEYDQSSLGSGDSVTLDGAPMTWDPGSFWFELARSRSSVGKWTYFVNASVETTYGISALNLNGQSVECIWDQVLVLSYASDDQRISIGSASSCHVMLQFSYDSSYVTDGTVSVNGVAAVYSGANGIWDFSEVRTGVQLVTYDTVLASGNTYGISSVDQNGQSLGQVWDRILVESYSVADARVNIGDIVTIEVTLIYEFDSAPVTDGMVTVNTIGATHAGLGIWQITASESSVTGRIYNDVAALGNTLGITQVSQNGQSQSVTWDQITVRGYSVADSRANLNDVVNVYVNLEYEYDDADVSDGSVSINGVPATYNGSGIWRIATSESIVTSNTYDLVVCTDNQYGITSVNQNLQSQVVIWDRIKVMAYDSSDSRNNIGSYTWINVTLHYEFDDSPVTDGAVSVNGYSFTHLEAGIWQHVRTESSAMGRLFDSVSCGDNEYHITAVDQNSQWMNIIWDSLTVSLTIQDHRIDIGGNASIYVTAVYDYDGAIYDGFIVLNDTTYVHDEVGRWSYTIATAAGDSYGIDVISINDEDYVIWDRLRVLPYTVSDEHCDVGTTQSIYATVEYEYDSTILTGSLGTVYLNGTSMIWNQSLMHWYQNRVYMVTGRWQFQVSGVTDDLHELTAVEYPAAPVSIIWDKIEVVLSADALLVNWHSLVNFTLIATRDYDGGRVQLLTASVNRNESFFVVGNFSDVWDGPVDATWIYTVISAIDDQYGLQVFSANLLIVTWTERPVVVIDMAFASDVDGRIDIVTDVTVYFHCKWSTNGSAVTKGSLFVNMTPYAINGSGWIDLTWSSASVIRLIWSVTGVDVNGIAQYDQRVTSPSMIWDCLRVMLIVADNRINVGENATIGISAIYAFDGTPYDGIITLNNTVYQYGTVGRRGYTASVASGGIHGITVIGYSDEEYIIWDSLRVYVLNNSVHINVGRNASIQVYALYDYDGKMYDGVLTLNDTVYILYSVGRKGYTCASASGDTYNITQIRLSGRIYVTWDSITVRVVVGNRYITVGTNASILVSGTFDYDGLPYIGTLVLNDTTYEYGTVGRKAYMCVLAIPVGHGVSLISNSDAEYIIWDQLEVFWSESQRTRADLSQEVDVMFRIRRSYTGSLFTDSDGEIYINGVKATFLSTESYWYITVTSGEVSTHSYSITGHLDLVGGIQVIDGGTEFTCTTTWDLIYVSRAGVWGSAPAFDPEIDSPAGRVLQCELEWTVTVYFYLNYMSDGAALSDSNTTVIVNGQNAIFVAERQRWELNVTSQGAGTMQYIIEEIMDPYGLTQVDQRGLYPTINWFPVRTAMGIATFGVIGLVGVGGALYVRRTRRRVAALEKALGPERVMSMEEAELPVKVREEILASLDWLRELQEQIPAMDTKVLLSVKEELRNAYDLYVKAFGEIILEEDLTDPGLKLKQALVKRIEVLIKIVDRELNARA